MPQRGITSLTSVRPFGVERFPDMNYAVVTCPGCSHYLTVDGQALLR